ncbi:MAG: amino acid adenylation domain-containing protein, partial [Bacteroidota bacterium]
QNIPENREERLEHIEIDPNYGAPLRIVSQRDLSIFVVEDPSGFLLTINFCTALYQASTIEYLLSHLEQLLEAIVEHPEQKLSALNLLPEIEKQQLLEQFNDTLQPYPASVSIPSLFEQQVQQHPHQLALVSGEQQWTYQELNQKANTLAHYLQNEHNLTAGDFVGIMMQRSEWMIISILGVLKAGAAYVPIAPDYPTERKAFMIEDTQLKLLLILSDQLFEVTTLEVPAFAIDIQLDTLELPDVPLQTDYPSSTPAYVMYTSGTTGQPKGIVVSHQNVVKLACESKAIAIQSTDRVLQWSNFAFDGSVYDIFASLLNGACLQLIEQADAADPARLAQYIQQHQISVAFITTALFNAFVDFDIKALLPLRKLLFGGELVSTQHVQKALAILGPDRMVHVYGPTETTVYASFYPIKAANGNTIPIGQPLSNTQIYIVNEYEKVAGIGVVGEIWIGGDGVATGYLNRPQLSAEKFMANPFGNGTIYKTGDLARMLPDGQIEFIGRRDTQIKMRGYRIELGEIENHLQQLPTIQQALVLAQKDSSGTQQLVAYLVVEGDFDKTVIQQRLKTQLPEYMIPPIMISLPEMPLTLNGKIDKKALPAPDLSNLSTKAYVAPSTPTQTCLVNIWQQLLEVEQVGIHDDFFDLGGHSLLATRVISEIRTQLHVELSIRDLFHHTILHDLATFIEQQTPNTTLPQLVAQQRPQRIPLSYAQERLWFIDQMQGSIQYHIPMILRISGQLDLNIFNRAFQAIIQRHEILQTIIKEEDGQTFQQVVATDWRVQVIDDPLYFEEQKLAQLIDELINTPFRLSEELPIKVYLVRMNETDDYLFLNLLHHIATDGWSNSILIDEF